MAAGQKAESLGFIVGAIVTENCLSENVQNETKEYFARFGITINSIGNKNVGSFARGMNSNSN